MHIDASERCKREHGIRQDAAEGSDDDDVRGKGPEVLNGLFCHPLGLKDREAELCSLCLHSRGLQLLAARAHSIRPCHDLDDVERLIEGRKRWHREIGGAHEDDAHADHSATSPGRAPLASASL